MIHEHDTPVVIQDFTPAYMPPTAPKKRFFRQLIDLPGDMQELRTIQYSLHEDLQETTRKVNRFEERIDGLSFSVDPLINQVSELQKQGLEIEKLSKGLKTTKVVIAFLLVTNIVLLGLILKN